MSRDSATLKVESSGLNSICSNSSKPVAAPSPQYLGAMDSQSQQKVSPVLNSSDIAYT